MPKVFEQDGFRFYFYSNDHLPIHIHVGYSGGEAVFVIGDVIVLRESRGMGTRDLSKAERLAEEHKELIIAKWNEHLG